MPKKFISEFNSLRYIFSKAESFLLFAHDHPDADTLGSALALASYLEGLGKVVRIVCPGPIPKFFERLDGMRTVDFPEHIRWADYEAIIACDSVERGYEKYQAEIAEGQVTAIIDHHPDISLQADINIVDADYSSSSEIIYDLLIFCEAKLTREIASFLLLGILGDTGVFQNSNTTARVMEICSDLVRHGASVNKLVGMTFADKKLATLRLWGRAFEKAKIDQKSGMIATAITLNDLEECQATSEDVAQVASILNTVPGTRFSLILSERPGGLVKGSLRSEEYKGVDVSKISHSFGGGGHRLASGFEVHGQIRETATGWEVI